MKPESIKKLLWGLLGLRFVVGLGRAFLPFTLPEVWRQTDTLGVSLRFWLRWTVEPATPHALLPAILNSGDTYGLMATELPLMNWLTAPCFAWGITAGRPLALILQHTLIFGLVIAVGKIWRRVRYEGVSLELVILCLPLLSLGADWSGKFMPDFLALLLLLAAVGLSWEKVNVLLSVTLLALAVAIKPTCLFAVAILALNERPLRQQAVWVGVGTLLGLAYYGGVVPYLHSLQEAPSLFWMRKDYPWVFLAEWVADPPKLTKFLLSMPFVPYTVVILLPLWILRRKQHRAVVAGRVWWLVLVQILAVASISGAQGITHPYYYLSTLPLFALLWLDRLQHEPKLIALLLALAMTFRLLEISWGEVKPVVRPAQNREWVAMSECRAIKQAHPEFPWGKGQVFRSDIEWMPFLGLCFGERQNSTRAAYGFFWKETPIPPDCQPVEAGHAIQLVRCGVSAPGN